MYTISFTCALHMHTLMHTYKERERESGATRKGVMLYRSVVGLVRSSQLYSSKMWYKGCRQWFCFVFLSLGVDNNNT